MNEPNGHIRVGETGWSDGLIEAGLGSPRAAELMSWPTRIARMLEVEVALAQIQAERGIIEADDAAAIARHCDANKLDLDALAEAAAGAASPVIALLGQLRAQIPDDVGAVVHHGATSQDIVDTAAMLQVRAALQLLREELAAVATLCAQLADTHRGVILPGRTLKQQAVPITFGLIAARWLGMVDRRLSHLDVAESRILTVQLGGAAGTLAVFPDDGVAVMDALAERLGLSAPDLPWHAERDRIIELAGVLEAVAAVTGKIARDIVDLASTEIGEIITAPRSGPGSSAMPHKGRNPVDAMAARAASRLALGELQVLVHAASDHEHERAAGAWQAEWVAIPSAVVRTVGGVERLRAALEIVEVVADRGRRNLAANLDLPASEALASALAPQIGWPDAQALVAEVVAAAVQDGLTLAQAAANDPRLSELLPDGKIAEVCDPAASLSNVDDLIDRALAAHESIGQSLRELPDTTQPHPVRQQDE